MDWICANWMCNRRVKNVGDRCERHGGKPNECVYTAADLARARRDALEEAREAVLDRVCPFGDDCASSLCRSLRNVADELRRRAPTHPDAGKDGET